MDLEEEEDPDPADFIQNIRDPVEKRHQAMPYLPSGALIVLAGEFNQLDEQEIVERTGLIPLIHQPTRGDNTLDRMLVSEQSYDQVKVLTSTVKTDHMAILALKGKVMVALNKQPMRVMFRSRTPQQHATLLRTLPDIDFPGVTNCDEPCEAWEISTR
jgi:hypothetical protein